MTDVAAPRSVKPLLRRSLARAVGSLAVLAAVGLVLAALVFEPAPRVRDPGAPDAIAAARTRDVVARLKAFVDSDPYHVNDVWDGHGVEIHGYHKKRG